MANGKYLAQDFIEVIPGSAGIVKEIAARVGCSRTTALRYIRQYATIREAYEDEVERVIDEAESVIIHDITENEDVQTAKWYLTMKGAGRGYAQLRKTQISGPDEGPVQIQQVAPDLSGLSTAELEQLLEIYDKLDIEED